MGEHRRKVWRGTLKALGAALLLTVLPAAGGWGSDHGGTALAADRLSLPRIDRWRPYIEEASGRFGIPQDWIRRVMRAESGGRTLLHGRPITSRAGAMGLMQIMPGTWSELRLKHGLGPDPHHPRDNILAGAAYLRALYDRFGYPGLFAAYNSGPARYTEHLASGRPLPAETAAYVAAVGLDTPRAAPNIGQEPRQAEIFVSLVDVPSRDLENGRSSAAPGPLFVRLSSASTAD